MELGTPAAVTTLPPVVFINGYQFEGSSIHFRRHVRHRDQVLESNGEASLFFSTCSLPSTATIEDLVWIVVVFWGRNMTGQPVTTVDVVAHSMAGPALLLLPRENTSECFNHPAATHVRKAVFLATPNFGTPIASLLGVTEQVDEMASGSSFLFGLDTWNQGTDDRPRRGRYR